MSAPPPYQPAVTALGHPDDDSHDLVDEWHDTDEMERPAPTAAASPAAAAPAHDALPEPLAEHAQHTEPIPAGSHSEAVPVEFVDRAVEGHKADPSYLALWGAPRGHEYDLPHAAQGSIYPFGQHQGGVSSAFLPQASHMDLSAISAPEKELHSHSHSHSQSQPSEQVRPYVHRPRRSSGAASIAPARPPSLFNQNEYTDLPGSVSIGPRAQVVTHALRRRLFVPYPQLDVVLSEHGELLDAKDVESGSGTGTRVAFEDDNMLLKLGRGTAYDFVQAIVFARRRKIDADIAGATEDALERSSRAGQREATGLGPEHTGAGLGQFTASDMAGAETSGVLFDDALLESPEGGTSPLPAEQVDTDDQTTHAQAEEADKALECSLRDGGLVEPVAGAGPRKASELEPDHLFLPDPRPWKPLRWVRRTNPRQLLIYVAGTVLPPHETIPGSAGKGMLPKAGPRGGIGVVFSPPSKADPWTQYSARTNTVKQDKDAPLVQVTPPDGAHSGVVNLPVGQERREADLARRLEAAPSGLKVTPHRAVLRAALAALEWMDWWRPAPAGAGAKAVVLAVAEPWLASGISDWIHEWRRDGWVLSGAESQRPLGVAGAKVPDRDLWELLEAVVGQYEEAGCGVLFWALPPSTPGLVSARLAAAEGAARPKQQPALVRWRKKEVQNTGSQPLRGVAPPKPKKKANVSPPPLNTRALSQGIGIALSASIVKNNPRAAKYLFSGNR